MSGRAAGDVADTIGADVPAAGAEVTGARTGTEVAGGALTGVTAGGTTISGTYGDLVIKSDGSYTYTLKTATIPANVANETFTYQITDKDGDTDLAQLVITLNQNASVPDVTGSTATVYEDGLADGVQHGPTSETQTGTFTVDGNNESYTLTLDGDVNPAQPITAVGQSVTTTKGVLTITSISAPDAGGVVTYGYSYTLTAALTHTGQGEINPLTDTITMTVSDATGDTDTTPGSIVISIVDDIPVAQNDANSVAEGLGNAVSGNVYDNVGASAGDVADTIGADVPAAGAEVTGARTGTEVAGGALTGVTAGGTTISGTYGNLVIKSDGSYTYTLKTATIPANVANETFTYQITDKDGDTDLAQLVITLNQNASVPNVTGSTATVYEDGLADGVQHGPTSETQTGTFTVAGNNESYTLTLDGDVNPAQPITAVGQFVTTTKGVLTITSISAPDGAGVVTYGYSYTLTAALTHTGQGEINPLTDTITMTVSDATGDTDTTPGSIVISIVDDIPVAQNDANSVAEGLGNAVSGNVYDNVGASAGDVADTIGADVPAAGAEVTGARTGTEVAGGALTGVTAGGTTISGTYGNLVIKSDGSYTYTLKTATIPANVANETFTYQITDKDGDTDLAQLVITLNQNASVPNVTGSTATVYEDGLADGVQHGPTSETQTGTFTVAGNNESYTLTLDGDVNPAQPITAVGQFVTTTKGVLTITSISAPDGAGVVTYGYSYTLTAALTHTGQGEINPLTDTITMTVSDATGDTDTTPGSIVISIVDDVPVANDNPQLASVDDNASGVTIGTVAGLLANDTYGADGQGSPNITIATGSLGGTVAIVAGNLVYTSATNITSPYAPLTETFTYTIKDGDGDTDPATFTVRITDTGPSITAASAAIEVDEEGLGGNPGGVSGDLAGQATSQTGTLAGLSFGTDGPGNIVLAQVADTGLRTLAGNVIKTTWDGTNHILTGEDAVTGQDIFTLTITNVSTGAYSFVLLQPVKHLDATSEDDTPPFNIGVTVTDAEGDPALGSISVLIDDDSPIFFVPTGQPKAIQDQQTDNNASDLVTLPAVGTLHFAPGADGAGSAMTITANLSGLTVGNQTLTGSQIGNVYYAYVENGSSPGYQVGETVAFTVTVNPTAGTSGQYVFDLVTPLDPTVTPTPIGGSSSFGAGPTGYQILQSATAQDLAVVSGYHMGGTFNEATWLSTGSAGPASNYTAAGVNGSTAGWGIDNNNFNGTDEMFVWDFGSQATRDPDGAGAFIPPTQGPDALPDPPVEVQLPDISFATFDFVGYVTGDDIKYVVHFTDSTFVSGTIPNANLNSGPDWTYTAPGGKFIGDIEMFSSGTGSGKVDLVSVGVQSTSIDKTIPFTLTLTDRDGDQTASTPFTVHVKNGLAPFLPAAPIVLDLTGNGLHFQSLAAGLAVDYLGNGQPLHTAWAGKDDGILAIDLNDNGKIDSGKEFVFGGEGKTDLQGLAAQYDSNHDGLLDAKDAQFAKFGVWQDANSNGVNDAGEFKSLAEMGITSIDLTSDGKAYVAADGDVTVHGETSFTWSDGSTGVAADASFAVSGLTGAAGSSSDTGDLMGSLMGLAATAPSDGSEAGQSVSDPASILQALDDGNATNFIDNLVNSLAGGGSGAQNDNGGTNTPDLAGLLAMSVGSGIDHAHLPFDMSQLGVPAEALAAG